MKLKTKAFALILPCCQLLSSGLRAQSPATEKADKTDSLIIQTAYDSAVNQYHAYVTPETHLLRGPEYITYAQLLKEGHPYFGENSMRYGSVFYDGIHYEHVKLLHDLVTGEVVTNDYYNVFKISLIADLVDSFSIEDHHFIHLRDSLNPSQPRNGFYEVLYAGHLVLLKKEKKSIQEDLYSSDHAIKYIHGTDSVYYLRNGNVYHPVNNSKSLLNLLQDKKKEIKKYIRSEQLSMRKDRENTLIKVIAWYDSQPH